MRYSKKIEEMNKLTTEKERGKYRVENFTDEDYQKYEEQLNKTRKPSNFYTGIQD